MQKTFTIYLESALWGIKFKRYLYTRIVTRARTRVCPVSVLGQFFLPLFFTSVSDDALWLAVPFVNRTYNWTAGCDVTTPRLLTEVSFKMAMSLVNIIRKGKVSASISDFFCIISPFCWREHLANTDGVSLFFRVARRFGSEAPQLSQDSSGSCAGQYEPLAG